jgi:hypothetical protein
MPAALKMETVCSSEILASSDGLHDAKTKKNIINITAVKS